MGNVAIGFRMIVIVNNLFRRKKRGHEWPKLKIISASKTENKKKMAQIYGTPSATKIESNSFCERSISTSYHSLRIIILQYSTALHCTVLVQLLELPHPLIGQNGCSLSRILNSELSF